jgi:uncharacterized Zn-binding protein involved in type VI secretion
MPAVCVEGDTLSTGHDCVATTTLDTPPQTKVKIGGILVAIVGTPTVAHPFPPNPPCANHVASLNKGSAKVSIGGIPVGRIGDSADAGSMTTGSDGSSGKAEESKVSAGGDSVTEIA